MKTMEIDGLEFEVGPEDGTIVLNGKPRRFTLEINRYKGIFANSMAGDRIRVVPELLEGECLSYDHWGMPVVMDSGWADQTPRMKIPR